MKLFKQFLLIISFSYLGEIVSKLFNLPIPGSVIGMLLLFTALYFKVVKVEEVDTVGTFLLDNLSILFLPAGVGIMVYFPVIRETWWSLLIITIITTVLTMAVVGRIVQGVKRKFEGDSVELDREEQQGHVTRIDE
ncbi:CidA/LrgA family protein [Vagococcus intermedius]|uniref:CidA/LrgA family protein n=1 Tax=Vagococcus intermedius TaxID=2991418 RepID=A0AAF0CV49_9ENTE|nr:CidA/LrgA family protein [Vagococcus intermedius]WEG73524.1 CidA/LrgA family protein [Vagococcus intermedius]WEG75606.1 CidA/LrgA family protein [Vagococcus intermedius]